jgi:DNA replication protein DnaC
MKGSRSEKTGLPCGVGKSFVACALAQKACRDGYSALYTRAQALLRDLAMARADGSLRNLLARLSRIDVLVIDDWAMATLSEPERRDFWEICEDRSQMRSTILTSQLPVSRWHEQIGDPALADGILDRLVHNAHRIEMRGRCVRIRGRIMLLTVTPVLQGPDADSKKCVFL